MPYRFEGNEAFSEGIKRIAAEELGGAVNGLRTGLSEGGIACHPIHAEKDALLSAANEALHRAKVEGRGRAAIYVESKMILKSNYYSKASLERLAKLSDARNQTEASLLREALDDLFVKHGDAL